MLLTYLGWRGRRKREEGEREGKGERERGGEGEKEAFDSLTNMYI